MRRTFYPPLIATFLVLALFNANIHRIASPGEVVVPLLIAVGMSGAIWCILRLALKSWWKAALPTCLVTVGLLEYGHFRGTLELALAVWITAFTVVALLTTMLKKVPTTVFNIIAICLVITVLVPFGAFTLRASPPAPVEGVTEGYEDSNVPDIYYIIVDEYSRSDILLDMGFDNSEFIDWLRGTGFHVAEDSYANYPHTLLSLPSALYMNYLLEEGNPYTTDKMIRAVWVAEVPKLLKQRGYTLINISTFFRCTDVDIDYNYDKYSEFTLLLHEMTIFYTGGTKERHTYNRALYKFDKLKQVPQIPKPTFTFVHIMATHAPYVFNPDGSYRGHDTPTGKHFTEAYIQQVQAMNKMLRETIEIILSEGAAIIILQSDTGTQPRGYIGYQLDHNGMFDNIMQEDPRIVWARLANLNAVYPSISDKFTSPVNTFRIIFNHYFGANYEILPDRYFWTVRAEPPYETFEVTDELREYEGTK